MQHDFLPIAFEGTAAESWDEVAHEDATPRQITAM